MENFKITYCTHSELPLVKKLWINVFEDKEIFIDQFFHHLYQDNILICKLQDEIVSMAALLPATFAMEGKEYKMHYVYACATAPPFQEKKIMTKILDKAFKDTTRKGGAGLFLLPANDELYGFYEKNGFKEFFYHDVQKFYFPDFSENTCYKIQRIPVGKYYTLRQSYLHNKNAIHYPLSHFEFIDDAKLKTPAKFYEILYDQKSAAIGFIEEKHNHVLVKEFLYRKRSEEMFYTISQYFEKEKIILHTSGGTYRDAMLRSNEKDFLKQGLTGYFNFALD